MAAKTASAEPALRDLAAEISRAGARAQNELADCRARLAEFRGQRELLLAAPLHHSDLESELVRHIEKKGKEALDFLRLTVEEMRQRTGPLATTAPEQMATFDPFDKGTLPEIVAFLSDARAVAQRILQAVGADLDSKVPEGLPLVERRERVAALDQKIAAAEQHEADLIQGLQAAGIRVAMPNDPPAEPQSGDEKVIGGVPCRWVSYTGIPGTFGWLATDQIEQAA
jgi:hypothetical protein